MKIEFSGVLRIDHADLAFATILLELEGSISPAMREQRDRHPIVGMPGEQRPAGLGPPAIVENHLSILGANPPNDLLHDIDPLRGVDGDRIGDRDAAISHDHQTGLELGVLIGGAAGLRCFPGGDRDHRTHRTGEHGVVEDVELRQSFSKSLVRSIHEPAGTLDHPRTERLHQWAPIPESGGIGGGPVLKLVGIGEGTANDLDDIDRRVDRPFRMDKHSNRGRLRSPDFQDHALRIGRDHQELAARSGEDVLGGAEQAVGPDGTGDQGRLTLFDPENHQFGPLGGNGQIRAGRGLAGKTMPR